MIQGLSNKEVKQKIIEGKTNNYTTKTSKTYKQIIIDNLFTLFNFINVLLAVFIAFTKQYENMLFLGVMFWNLFLGIFQEIRAKRTLDKIALVVNQSVCVIREKIKQNITKEEVVLGDYIYLKNGAQIVSDGIVVEGKIEVDESLLSGESDAIKKEVDSFLYSGSFVVAGECIYKVTSVGKDNYAYKIIENAKEMSKHPSKLRDSLDTIIKYITLFIIPIGILLFLKQRYIMAYTWEESILSTSAALIGMIPEGLVILTSIALMLGVINLAKHKTLVQELYCLETLARIDTLCLDKTGTITEGKVEVVSVISENRKELETAVKEILYYLKEDNSTSKALYTYFKEQYTSVKEVLPFSSQRKYSGIIKEEVTYLMGAYEMFFDDYNKEIETYAKEGYRIISVVSKKDQYELLGYILLKDNIRENVKDILNYFKEQDVDLKIISGDHPDTVSLVAKKAHINNYDKAIDMSKVKEIDETVMNHSIFGRVSPQQKKEMITYLKNKGHFVGMSGDGVNDVLAFKEANISIAMNSGSDMAKQSANLVLLDNNFDALPYVLKEGRRVINNISKVATLFLTKTIFSFLMSLLTLFVSFPYPFVPIHLTFMSSLCIGIPAFFLAIEPNYRRVKDDFLENVVKISLPSAISVVLCIIYIYECAKVNNYSTMLISQLSLIALCMNAYIVLVKCAYPFTKLRIVLLIMILLGLIIGFTVLPTFISLDYLVFSDIYKHIIVFLVILIVLPVIGSKIITYFYELKGDKQ